MLENIFTKIAIGITAIATIVGGWFGLVPDNNLAKLQDKIVQLEKRQESQSLGAFYQVGGERYQLWGSGVTASATSVILQSLQMPVSNQELLMDDFGDIGYATIEPGSATKREFISFTGITQSGTSDQATLTGVLRGLSPTSPYTASTTLQLSHSGGSSIIFSNSPAYYAEFALRRNNELIWGDWTYSATNTPQYNSAPTFTSASQEFASVKLVEDTANAGAATSSEIMAGIVEIVNSSELGVGTATGTTGAIIVLQNRFATSTPYATTSIPVTKSNGKLHHDFIDVTESFSWTASTTFSATTTFNANIIAGNASSTMGTTTFNSVPYVNADPVANNQLVRKSYADGAQLGLFGDGSDGVRVIDANATLTQDVYYTNLTISATSTPTLFTGGFRIFVSGTLTNGGTISRKGNSAAGTVIGLGATSSSATLGGGGNGGIGTANTGAGGGGGGVIMIAAKTLNNSGGTITAAGGNGGNAGVDGADAGGGSGASSPMGLGGAGGNGGVTSPGAGGTVTAPAAKYGGFHSLPNLLSMRVADPTFSSWVDTLIQGGAGGGGGSDNTTQVGGGGGGGGGVIVIISANFTTGTETVAGGSAGSNTGGGTAAVAGSAGTKITITP